MCKRVRSTTAWISSLSGNVTSHHLKVKQVIIHKSPQQWAGGVVSIARILGGRTQCKLRGTSQSNGVQVSLRVDTHCSSLAHLQHHRMWFQSCPLNQVCYRLEPPHLVTVCWNCSKNHPEIKNTGWEFEVKFCKSSELTLEYINCRSKIYPTIAIQYIRVLPHSSFENSSTCSLAG